MGMIMPFYHAHFIPPKEQTPNNDAMLLGIPGKNHQRLFLSKPLTNQRFSPSNATVDTKKNPEPMPSLLRQFSPLSSLPSPLEK